MKALTNLFRNQLVPFETEANHTTVSLKQVPPTQQLQRYKLHSVPSVDNN